MRQPVVASPNETVRVYGEEMPVSMEAVLLAVAERLALPNFGPGGFGPGGDLRRPEDFYLRMAANIAFGDAADGSDTCPDASPEEEKILLDARKHLPPAVFDARKWAAAVGPAWWPKVVYTLDRGGRWWSYEHAWQGEQVRGRYGKLVNLYHEKAALTRDSMSGAWLGGAPAYKPIADSLGAPLDQGDAPFRLITNRNMLATKSRSISNYWLTDILPENAIEMSTLDARRLGFREGDTVWLASAANPQAAWALGDGRTKRLQGKLHVTDRIRPGVISFELGYGHWAYGSSEQIVDGRRIPPDPRRGAGIHANSAMAVDRFTRSPLSDVVGGSAVFYDSRVYVVRA